MAGFYFSSIAADVWTEAMMSTESCINTDAHMKKCQKLNVNKLKIAKKKGHTMSMNKMCTFSNRINYDYGLAKQDMQAIMKWGEKRWRHIFAPNSRHVERLSHRLQLIFKLSCCARANFGVVACIRTASRPLRQWSYPRWHEYTWADTFGSVLSLRSHADSAVVTVALKHGPFFFPFFF